MSHAQSVEVRVGGYVYFWQVDYNWIDPEIILSFCSSSKPKQAWSFVDGMTRGNYACISASNIKPLLEHVVNKHMAGYPPVIHYYDDEET